MLRADWNSWFRSCAVLLLYMATSAWCLASFMDKWGFREDESRFGLTQMMEHTAHRPFAYRVLVPWIVNGMGQLIPLRSVEHALDRLDPQENLRRNLLRQRYFKAEGAVAWTRDVRRRYLFTYLLLFAVLVGTMFVLRKLTDVHLPGSVLCDFAPIAFVTLLPLTFIRGGYYYDFPELLFLAASFLLAVHKRYFLLVAVFGLAVLNKESNLLLPSNPPAGFAITAQIF